MQILKSSNPQILKSSKNSLKTFARLSSAALLLITHTSFAAITAGKPSDISPNYFTVAANGGNCDITGVSTSTQGSGAASNSVSPYPPCQGNGTLVGSSTAGCFSAAAPVVSSLTKPTTTVNVGALYFKQVSGAWKRYPGWFTLDSSCNASNFYYDNVLDATITIGQTSSTVSAPIFSLNHNPVETFATEIELK